MTATQPPPGTNTSPNPGLSARYIVWSPGGPTNPRKTFHSFERCRDAAMDMARKHPGQHFYAARLCEYAILPPSTDVQIVEVFPGGLNGSAEETAEKSLPQPVCGLRPKSPNAIVLFDILSEIAGEADPGLYIAMDEDGEVYSFTDHPYAGAGRFHSADSSFIADLEALPASIRAHWRSVLVSSDDLPF